MHDFDDDDIVVSGAGGSNYIKIGNRPPHPTTGKPMTLKQAQKAKAKAKPTPKAAKNKKGVAGGKRIPAGAKLKPKGKRTPQARG